MASNESGSSNKREERNENRDSCINRRLPPALVSLESGEQLRAEGGAMVAMRDVKVETGATGGLFKSLKRSILGGESFFQNTFTATSNNAMVMLAPALTGDVMVRELNNEDLIVQSGAYLGSSMGINVSTDWGGARTFFGGEGLFMLRCSGSRARSSPAPMARSTRRRSARAKPSWSIAAMWSHSSPA